MTDTETRLLALALEAISSQDARVVLADAMLEASVGVEVSGVWETPEGNYWLPNDENVWPLTERSCWLIVGEVQRGC